MAAYYRNSGSATATLSTARPLSLSAAGQGTLATTIAKSTGYIELRSITAASALTAGTPTATTPAPSGNGWLLDDSSILAVKAGNVDVSLRVQASATTISSGFYVRLFKRSSAGVYTSIGMATIASAAMTTGATTKTASFTVGADVSFGAGDKLYCDVIASVTANTANSNQSSITHYFGTTSDSVTPIVQSVQSASATFTAASSLSANGMADRGYTVYMPQYWSNVNAGHTALVGALAVPFTVGLNYSIDYFDGYLAKQATDPGGNLVVQVWSGSLSSPTVEGTIGTFTPADITTYPTYGRASLTATTPVVVAPGTQYYLVLAPQYSTAEPNPYDILIHSSTEDYNIAGNYPATSWASYNGNSFMARLADDAAGSVASTVSGTATLVQPSTLSADGSITATGSTNLVGLGSLACDALVSSVAAASLTQTSSLAPTALLTTSASSTFTSASSLTAAGDVAKTGTATVSGASSLSCAALVTAVAGGTLAGAGSLSVSAVRTTFGAGTFQGLAFLGQQEPDSGLALSAIWDEFDGTITTDGLGNGYIGNWETSSFSMLSNADGRLRLDGSANDYIFTTYTYSMRNSSMQVQVTNLSLPNNTDAMEVSLAFKKAGDYNTGYWYHTIWLQRDSNGFLYINPPSLSGAAAVLYNATSHKWFKVIDSGPSLDSYTSPDGITWTLLCSTPWPPDVPGLMCQPELGVYAPTGYGYVDHFNVSPLATCTLTASSSLMANAGGDTLSGVANLAQNSALSANADVWTFGALQPDVILVETNLTGVVASIQDDPDAPDANWLTVAASSNADLRVGFQNPPANLRPGTNYQQFRIRLRPGS